MRAIAVTAGCCWVVLSAGCFPFWSWDDDDDLVGPAGDWSAAPSIDSIEIADWPPVGPEGTVRVSVRDDEGLDRVQFRFLETVAKPVSGTGADIEVTGSELGEGLGTLTVTAWDTHGGWAQREVRDLLVDLSAPEITLGKTVLPAAGPGAQLEAWVADAWVLGRVELVFAGVTRELTFEQGYPSTLGEAWDYSLVTFSTALLPETSATALMTAWDAAGNSVSESFELTIDGIPPALAILSPAPHSTVSGAFDVQLSAADPGGGPVWVDLWLGGTAVATAVGPALTVELDASELAPGPLELEAVAVDLAGNESDVISVPLVVE